MEMQARFGCKTPGVSTWLLALFVVFVVPGDGNPGVFPGCVGGSHLDVPLTCDALAAERQRLSMIKKKNIITSSCPTTLGRLEGTDIVVGELYYCSDVCPDAGSIHLVIQNVTSAEECGALGGQLIINPAWGGIIGCRPPC